jgi:hypothetical protein
MQKSTRRKLRRADGVRAFLRINPSTEAAVVALTAELDEAVSRATALIRASADRNREAITATAAGHGIRERLRHGLFRVFRGAGRRAARKHPELEPAFAGGEPRDTNLDFEAAARSLVEAARTHVEALAGHGVTPELVGEASALIDRYVAEMHRAQEARGGRVQANAELEGVAREISDIVLRIDGLMRHRFADDADLLAAWRSARSVAGPVYGRNGNGREEIPAGPDAPAGGNGGDPDAPPPAGDGGAHANA